MNFQRLPVGSIFKLGPQNLQPTISITSLHPCNSFLPELCLLPFSLLYGLFTYGHLNIPCKTYVGPPNSSGKNSMIYKTLSDPARGYFLPFLTHDTFTHISIQLLTCNHLQFYNLFASTFTIYPCDSSLVYSRSAVRGIFLKLKTYPIIPLVSFNHFPFFLE